MQGVTKFQHRIQVLLRYFTKLSESFPIVFVHFRQTESMESQRKSTRVVSMQELRLRH